MNSIRPQTPQTSPTRQTLPSQVDFTDLATVGLAETLALWRLWGESACFEHASTFGEALVQGLFSDISQIRWGQRDAAVVQQLAQLLEMAYRDSETFRRQIDALSGGAATVQAALPWELDAVLERDASFLLSMAGGDIGSGASASASASADAQRLGATASDGHHGADYPVWRARAMLTDIVSLMVPPHGDDVATTQGRGDPIEPSMAVWQELMSGDSASARFAFLMPTERQTRAEMALPGHVSEVPQQGPSENLRAGQPSSQTAIASLCAPSSESNLATAPDTPVTAVVSLRPSICFAPGLATTPTSAAVLSLSGASACEWGLWIPFLPGYGFQPMLGVVAPPPTSSAFAACTPLPTPASHDAATSAPADVPAPHAASVDVPVATPIESLLDRPHEPGHPIPHDHPHAPPSEAIPAPMTASWAQDIQRWMTGVPSQGRRAMALLYLLQLPAARWKRSLKAFSEACHTLSLKRLVDYEGRRLRPAGWIALFEDWRRTAKWHAFNKARQRVSLWRSASVVCAEVGREYGIRGLHRCFLEQGRLQVAGRRLAEMHEPALSESACRTIRARLIARGDRVAIPRADWPSWPFEASLSDNRTPPGSPIPSTSHAQDLEPVPSIRRSPLASSASTVSVTVPTGPSTVPACFPAGDLPRHQQQALAHFHKDYRGRLHTVHWLLDFMRRPQQQRRCLRLDAAQQVLVSRRQRSLSVMGWTLLLRVWQQSASCAALAQWQAQTLDDAAPTHGGPMGADAGKRLSRYGLPDAWFEACLSDSGELTPFAHSLCGLPIRASLCRRIRRTFKSCPKHIRASNGRLPQWPACDSPAAIVGERDDTELLRDLTASPEPIERLRKRIEPLIGERNDVVRRIKLLLILHTLPLEEWESCSLDTMLELLGAGRSLSNYVNHSERLIRTEGWSFMLLAWRRRAQYEALRDAVACQPSRVEQARGALRSVLRDIHARYGGAPIDHCFDEAGQLTKRGRARIAQGDDDMLDEGVCRQIQLAFASHPQMAAKYASQLPKWPGPGTGTGTEPSALAGDLAATAHD